MPDADADAPLWVEFDTSELTSPLDPELIDLLIDRKSTIHAIVRAREKGSR